MKLWKRAVGVLKDKRSIYVAGVSRRTSYRNPHLEAIIIKATSHDDSFVDYKNFQRVYQWARTSPLYMKPLIWSLSNRMDKTRTWVVALKGLMLIHGVICCKIPAIQRIGRLPFDLSSFSDGHTKPSKAWGFNAFIRAYFAYLDQKSFLTFSEIKENNNAKKSSLGEELRRLVTWQSLMDLLLQVRPQGENMRRVGLVFEAMICVVTEVFEVYEKMRRLISQAVARAYEDDHIWPRPGDVEVNLANGIMKKATVQGDELCLFFELCREMGVLNASFSPKVERIPAEEDFRELVRIVDRVSKINTREDEILSLDYEDHDDHQDGTIVIVDHNYDDEQSYSSKTIITDKWEIFDEENYDQNKTLMLVSTDHHHHHHDLDSSNHDHQLIMLSPPPTITALPDLITF
ncbi:hypothetical protein CsatB_027468 [Cannabis sativa]